MRLSSKLLLAAKLCVALMVLTGTTSCRRFNPESLSQIELERKLRSTEEKIIVYFWQPDCAGCRFMDPLLAETLKAYPHLSVAKVNVLEQEELRKMWNVRGTPTMFVMKRGRIQARADSAFPNRSAFWAWLKPSKTN